MGSTDPNIDINLVMGKLADIMLPAPPHQVRTMREKLLDINTDTSKVCVQYMDSRNDIRMIDLMTICHILNREQLYILEDEEPAQEDDFFRSLEESLNESVHSSLTISDLPLIGGDA